MQEYEIKISGSGTKDNIVNALLAIINSIETTDSSDLDNIEWEDATLFTEINIV